jgi:hypothetical protein
MFEGESDRYRRGNERSNIQKTNMSTERQKELKRKDGLVEILSIFHHRQHAARVQMRENRDESGKSGGEPSTSFAFHFVNSMTEECPSDLPELPSEASAPGISEAVRSNTSAGAIYTAEYSERSSLEPVLLSFECLIEA